METRVKKVLILLWTRVVVVGCGVRRGECSLKSWVWDGQGGGVGAEVILSVTAWGPAVGDLAGVGPVDERCAGDAEDALGELSGDPAQLMAGHSQ